MKFDHEVNTHRLTESEFWCDVILSRWRPWQPAARYCGVRRLPASPPCACDILARCMRYGFW